MTNAVVLHSDFGRTGRIDAPHRFAYKFAFEVLIRSVAGDDARSLFRDARCQNNAPLAWSPDGTTLYHAYDQIYAIDPETGACKVVSRFPERFSVNHHLYCSPDGLRIVFYRSTMLPPTLTRKFRDEAVTDECGVDGWFSIEIDGSDSIAFETRTKSHLFLPQYFWWQSAIDPNRCIIWKEDVVADGQIRIWSMDAAGENRSLLAAFPQNLGFECVPSPDGRFIAFGYRTETGTGRLGEPAGLFLRDSADHADRLIDRFGHFPAWSHGGRRLAYVAGSALWVYECDTGVQQKIVAIPDCAVSQPMPFGVGSGACPVWSHDDRFLAFYLQNTYRRTWNESRILAPEDIEQRHGLVDFESRRVHILHEGYWSRVAWQVRAR